MQNPTDDTLSFALADINGDGLKDVVLTNKSSELGGRAASNSVVINVGGRYLPIVGHSFDIYWAKGYEFRLAKVGDFNGDGKPDIVSLVEQSDRFLLAAALYTNK